jgi:hypothetical protein
MTETYTDEQLAHLSVSECLRLIIHRDGGVWTAQRALDALHGIGWVSTSGYPLNVAGNLLTRLWDVGALVRIDRGVYEVCPDVLDQVMATDIRTFKRMQQENPTVVRRPVRESDGEKTTPTRTPAPTGSPSAP